MIYPKGLDENIPSVPVRVRVSNIITSKKGEIFRFRAADGSAKLLGRDHGVRESTPRQYQPEGSEDLREELQKKIG